MNGNYHIGLVFLDNALSLFHITHLKAFGRRPVQTAVVRSRQNRFEARVREMAFKMLHNFRIKNTSESVEDKIKRLSDKNFVSEFKVNVGDY